MHGEQTFENILRRSPLFGSSSTSAHGYQVVWSNHDKSRCSTLETTLNHKLSDQNPIPPSLTLATIDHKHKLISRKTGQFSSNQLLFHTRSSVSYASTPKSTFWSSKMRTPWIILAPPSEFTTRLGKQWIENGGGLLGRGVGPSSWPTDQSIGQCVGLGEQVHALANELTCWSRGQFSRLIHQEQKLQIHPPRTFYNFVLQLICSFRSWSFPSISTPLSDHHHRLYVFSPSFFLAGPAGT